jgi:maleylpyruvate isomerase
VRPWAEIDEELRGCRAAHAQLVAGIRTLTDEEARRPSRLPGWTVGHVLTHLARNADSHRRLFDAAARGEVGERYPGGREQRDGEIEAGSGRPAAELVKDVSESAAALEAAWDAGTSWDAVGGNRGVTEPLSELPFKRWREVEVHHADLGLGFSFSDWSSGYVRRELHRAEMAWRASQPMGLTGLPAAALALPPPQRLAWLLGRVDVPGLPHAPDWL